MSIVFVFMGFEPAIELNNNNNRLVRGSFFYRKKTQTGLLRRLSFGLTSHATKWVMHFEDVLPGQSLRFLLK